MFRVNQLNLSWTDTILFVNHFLSVFMEKVAIKINPSVSTDTWKFYLLVLCPTSVSIQVCSNMFQDIYIPNNNNKKKLIKYSFIKYYCDIKDELLAKKKSKAVSQTSNKNIAVMLQTVCSAGPPQWTLLSQFLFTLCRFWVMPPEELDRQRCNDLMC